MAHYATASEATAIPAREGSLKDIYSRLTAVHEYAAKQAAHLDEIGDRAFGSAPTPLSNSQNVQAAKPAGLAYEISDLLNQITAIQARMQDAIERVSSAV